MAWREALLTRIGPGGFAGITTGRWFRVLRDIRFQVDFPYWGRTATITSYCIPNYFLSWMERLIYTRRVRSAKVEPPLFILGIWRSGTTHLHNLLAQDSRLAYPNTYQVYYPRSFLLTEKFYRRLLDFFLPATRPQDNMAITMGHPQEDEFAICCLTGLSPMMGWVAPRMAEFYDRYLTLREATPAERETWKSALFGFVQKLSFKYGKPLVLKSPAHTCRIKLLLELFPDARFVHIHRNPYEVYQSTVHTIRAVIPWWTLQRPNFSDLEERTIRQYRQVYDAFFEERGLITKGHFHELSYEALEKDPIGQLRVLYEALGLPDFEIAAPALRKYVECQTNYKKNAFQELSPGIRGRLASEWRRSFEEWGYAF